MYPIAGNIGSWVPNRYYNNISRFNYKFGGSWQYGIDIRIYTNKKILADFNLVVVKADHESAKFNSSPNFPAIQYDLI